jgi:FAD synthetase
MPKKKVLAGGVFNIIHPGHCHFLREARKLGDELLVVVAHDETVLRKGKKPIFPAQARMELVRCISCADRVLLGDPRDMAKVVRREKPDVIAVGYDQDIEEAREVARKAGIKCKVVRIAKASGYSTSSIVGEYL